MDIIATNNLAVTTPNGYSEINTLFGNPANHDGTLNKAWEAANILVAEPPAGWKLYYQNSPGSLIPVRGIAMHRLLKDSFTQVLTDIWDYAKNQIGNNASDDLVRNWLHDKRLDQTGGGFNYRKSSGNNTVLSLHAYGIAIDWDPAHNPHQKPLTKTLPDWWFDIWSTHGWTDGRHFNTPDPMHVQFATGA